MMNAVSPWAIAAIDQLDELEPITSFQNGNFTFDVRLSNEALWMLATFPSGANVAFRVAGIPGNELSIKEVTEKENGADFSLATIAGQLNLTIEFPEGESTVVHYTCRFKPEIDFLFPFWPKDILPLTAKFSQQPAGTIHAQQVGTRSGLLHFSMEKANAGTVFYFQNLTSLNPYFEKTKTSAGSTVGGNWPELGFSLPPTDQDPLPAGEDFVVTDAYVVLTEEVPKNDVQITQQFLNLLAVIYPLIDKEEPKYADWITIGDKGVDGISNHKGCWTFANGHPYLNAYLADYDTPPELMVQLAVLVPLTEHFQWTGTKHQIVDEIRDGLSAFYDESLGTLVRWLPSKEDNLDKSEEQKRERIMDSWYLHHPLMNLARLAQDGDEIAKEILLKSIDFAIEVAHHFDYEWPVFYRMDTLEVTKAETEPGAGGEKDVPGAYAKLMYEMWQLTKETRYLNEAKKAVKKLKGLGFDIFYQANNTAFASVVLLRLYKETKEQWYLDLSYACLASIFKNVQLWDCNYGNGKEFPYFFAIFPLKDAPYSAAYEEQEVYSTLHGYLQEAADIDILPSVKLLIGELVRYAIGRMPYYFPPLLPSETFAEEIKTGEIDPNLWIPLEDIHDGWERHGEVGQEVYGASASFGVIPRQYFKVPGEDFVLFVDYPIKDFKTTGKKTVSFEVLGHESMKCSFRILGKRLDKTKYSLIAKQTTKKGVEIQPTRTTADQIEFKINASQVLKLTW